MKKILFIIFSISMIGCIKNINPVKHTTPIQLELVNDTPPNFTTNDMTHAIIEKAEIDYQDELNMFLRKDEKAPFEGLLLNPSAAALIVSEYQAQLERSELALKTQRDFDLSQLNYETKRMYLELDILHKKSNSLLQEKENEINKLKDANYKLVTDRSKLWKTILISTGAACVGAGLGISVFAITQ